jgi:CPA1 family monovalent cation:H+ antiporter
VIHAGLLLPLLLVVTAASLGIVAERSRLPSPVIMLLAGVALAFVPGIPRLHGTPDIVLLVLLPPLLYSAGVGMSWRGFRSYKRPILNMAIGCVLFTAATVAAAAHYFLALDWAVGFVLGAVVSAPDAVPVVALLRDVRMPRRIVTILEGESLVNDAASLVILAFALDAVATGAFSLGGALIEFVVICGGEIAYGVALGWALLRLRRSSASPRGEVLLALATPYLAFWPAHALHGSGVIACVAAGLYVSWNGRRFIAPATRLQGYFIWDLVIFAAESMIFLVGGLQATEAVSALHRVGWQPALLAGVLVTVTVVVMRFVWVYPATYVPRLIPWIRRTEPSPDWRLPFVVSFAGLRGVDALAAALLVPEVLNGVPFPDRDLILFATFFAIGTSLLVAGPLLPAIVSWLGVDTKGREEAERNRMSERVARTEALDAVIAFLRCERREAAAVDDLLEGELRRRRADIATSGKDGIDADPVSESAELGLELLAIEREHIGRAYDDNRITDEARRRIERELDLQEAVLREKRSNSGRFV